MAPTQDEFDSLLAKLQKSEQKREKLKHALTLLKEHSVNVKALAQQNGQLKEECRLERQAREAAQDRLAALEDVLQEAVIAAQRAVERASEHAEAAATNKGLGTADLAAPAAQTHEQQQQQWDIQQAELAQRVSALEARLQEENAQRMQDGAEALLQQRQEQQQEELKALREQLTAVQSELGRWRAAFAPLATLAAASALPAGLPQVPPPAAAVEPAGWKTGAEKKQKRAAKTQKQQQQQEQEQEEALLPPSPPHAVASPRAAGLPHSAHEARPAVAPVVLARAEEGQAGGRAWRPAAAAQAAQDEKHAEARAAAVAKWRAMHEGEQSGGSKAAGQALAQRGKRGPEARAVTAADLDPITSARERLARAAFPPAKRVRVEEQQQQQQQHVASPRRALAGGGGAAGAAARPAAPAGAGVGLELSLAVSGNRNQAAADEAPTDRVTRLLGQLEGGSECLSQEVVAEVAEGLAEVLSSDPGHKAIIVNCFEAQVLSCAASQAQPHHVLHHWGQEQQGQGPGISLPAADCWFAAPRGAGPATGAAAASLEGQAPPPPVPFAAVWCSRQALLAHTLPWLLHCAAHLDGLAATPAGCASRRRCHQQRARRQPSWCSALRAHMHARALELHAHPRLPLGSLKVEFCAAAAAAAGLCRLEGNVTAFRALLAELLASPPTQPPGVLPALAAALELWPQALPPLPVGAAAGAGAEQEAADQDEGQQLGDFHAALQQLCLQAEAELSAAPGTPDAAAAAAGAQLQRQQQQQLEVDAEERLLATLDGHAAACAAAAALVLRHLGRRWWGWQCGRAAREEAAADPGQLEQLQAALRAHLPDWPAPAPELQLPAALLPVLPDTGLERAAAAAADGAAAAEEGDAMEVEEEEGRQENADPGTQQADGQRLETEVAQTDCPGEAPEVEEI